MSQASAIVPRGQVPIPPEIGESLKEAYKLKGGLTAFSKRAGIKSDTLRLAMKRGTTTARTLERLKSALEKSGLPALGSRSRADVSRALAGNGHSESAVEHIDHLPPAVLRHLQRVSGALLDGMQLMQLTVLKVLQEELVEAQGFPAQGLPTRPPKGR